MRKEINIETGEVTEHDDAPVVPLTFDRIAAAFETNVQNHLDVEAQANGYDDIVSACSYAAAPNPFQAESASFVTWRGEVWAYCYQELGKVQSGQRPMPTLAQILSELPTRSTNFI